MTSIDLLRDLARAKAIFQIRAIAAVMGIDMPLEDHFRDVTKKIELGKGTTQTLQILPEITHSLNAEMSPVSDIGADCTNTGEQ